MAGFRTEYEQKKWDSLEASQNFPFKKMLSGIATPEDLKRAQTLLAKYNKLAADVFSMGLQSLQKAAEGKVEKIAARASRAAKPLGRVALENLYTRVLQKEQAKQLPEIVKSVQTILDEHQNQFKSFMDKVLPPTEERQQLPTVQQKSLKELPALLRKDFKKANDSLEKANDTILQSTKDLVNKAKELEHTLGSDLSLSDAPKVELSSIDTTKIESLELSTRDSERVTEMMVGMQRRQDAFYSKVEASLLDRGKAEKTEKNDRDFQKWLKGEEALRKKLEEERKENSIAERFKRTRARFKQGVGTVGKFFKSLSMLLLRGLVGVGAVLLANEFMPQLKSMFDPDKIADSGKKLMDFSVKGIAKLKDEILPNFGSWVAETFNKLWPVIKQGASDIYQVLRTNQDGSLNLLGRLDAIAGADISKEAKMGSMSKEIAISLGLASPRRGLYEIDQDRDAAMTKIANIENYRKAIQEGRRHEVDPSTLGIEGLTKNSFPNMRGLQQEIKRTEDRLKELNKERHISEITSASGPSRMSGGTTVSPVVNTNSDTFNLTNNSNIAGFKTKPNTTASEEPSTIVDMPQTPAEGSPAVNPSFQLPRAAAAVSETASISGSNVPSWPDIAFALVNSSSIG